MVDSSDRNSLIEFFTEFRGLTAPELAIVANVGTDSIREWRRKCGIKPQADPFINSHTKQKKLYKEVPREIWDNADWLREHYIDKGIGIRTLAKMMGYRGFRSVCIHLERHGVKIRKVVHDHCRSADWLYYHYSVRKDYLKWCIKTCQEPDEYGGLGMSLVACAEAAGVVPYTILNWLSRFKIRMRDVEESHSLSVAVSGRRIRDNFFRLYREGKMPLYMGHHKFINGTKVDLKKTGDIEDD